MYGCRSGQATILLRGANDYMLDEMDRSLHDALCVVKRVLESTTVSAHPGCEYCWVTVHPYREYIVNSVETVRLEWSSARSQRVVGSDFFFSWLPLGFPVSCRW